MRSTLVISLLFCAFSGWTQIRIDKKIELTGTTQADKQVSNVGRPYDSTNLVRAVDIQNNHFSYFEVLGKDSLAGQTGVILNSYPAGTSLHIRIDTNNSGPVFLNVNNIGYKPLLKNLNDTLVANDLIAGQVASVIYDGVNFQLVNRYVKSCPAGFIEVNAQYCIEQDEHSGLNWWNAAVDCRERGAQLCSWFEWYYACQKAGLPILNMTNSNEWLNCPVNSPDQTLVMGNGDCKTGQVVSATIIRPYRCCYAK